MKTTLITGASSGIGYEMAMIEAEKNHNLVLVARRDVLLNELKETIQKKHDVNIKIIAKDLSNPKSAKEIYDEVKNENIIIDNLINNAGFGGYGKFHERDLDIEKSMIQVNIISLMELTHLFLNDMLSRNSGKIMNVSSTASFLPGPLQSIYFSTKAFITSFSQSISEEIKNSNVTITTLCPGAVDSGFVKAGDLEGVSLWDNAATSRSVAEYGIKAMEKGKLIAINDKFYSFLVNYLIPLAPRKLVLKTTMKNQTKRF